MQFAFSIVSLTDPAESADSQQQTAETAKRECGSVTESSEDARKVGMGTRDMPASGLGMKEYGADEEEDKKPNYKDLSIK